MARRGTRSRRRPATTAPATPIPAWKRRVAVILALGLGAAFAVLCARFHAAAKADAAAAPCPPGVLDLTGCRWTVAADVSSAHMVHGNRSSSYYITVNLGDGIMRDVRVSGDSALFDEAASVHPPRLSAHGRLGHVRSLSDGHLTALAADSPVVGGRTTFAASVLALTAGTAALSPDLGPWIVRRRPGWARWRIPARIAMHLVWISAALAGIIEFADPSMPLAGGYAVAGGFLLVLLAGIAVIVYRKGSSRRPVRG